MPFLLIRNDITKMETDAIVNTANTDLKEGSGVSRAIYLAAGEKQLQKACEKIGHCDLGGAVITEGFGLTASYIIHAVGPIWRGGSYGEEWYLRSAYTESMKLALEKGLTSVAFPLLSSGNYGYPKSLALSVAINAVSEFLMEHELLVYLVIYDDESFELSRSIFCAIEEYIDGHYVEEKYPEYYSYDDVWGGRMTSARLTVEETDFLCSETLSAEAATRFLDSAIQHMGQTFSQMLLHLIDRKGLTDPQVYHKANISRKHFSKIRNNPDYSPNKKTVIALSIALELSLDSATDLLHTAGFSLSNSSKFDVIIRFCLENRIYDVYKINEILFYYEQPLLGS